MVDKEEVDALLDRLLAGRLPEEIIGRDGLLDTLTSSSGSSCAMITRRRPRCVATSNRTWPRRPEWSPNQCPETQRLYRPVPYRASGGRRPTAARCSRRRFLDGHERGHGRRVPECRGGTGVSTSRQRLRRRGNMASGAELLRERGQAAADRGRMGTGLPWPRRGALRVCRVLRSPAERADCVHRLTTSTDKEGTTPFGFRCAADAE